MKVKTETKQQKAGRLVDVQERIMGAFRALSSSNNRWADKLYDAYLELSPLQADDFPMAVRGLFAEIQQDFESLTFLKRGSGSITSSPKRCKSICLKIVSLIEEVSWEAVSLIQDTRYSS